jgi:A/G-specific adenine glycosylase
MIPLPPGWTARTLPAVRRALLAWFDAHRRPLPWRADRDPYRVWVSEVMLQQTTVAAAGPYFERFVAAFPTVQSLAAADEQQVLKLWEGLGYYRRARHLHAAARRVVAEHAGTVPSDPAAFADLPGVGRYILGAVLSQAFDARAPIVEANSLRVLARWFGYPGDPRTGPGKRWVWQAAEAVLPNERCGDFNQAVMELGATVCKPLNPRCGACPVARWCEANRLGRQADIPPPAVRPEPTAVREVGLAIRDGDRVLWVRRRPDAGRWQNMWELPHAELKPGESADDGARRLAALVGLAVRTGAEVATVKHGVTRWAITLTVLAAERTGGAFTPGEYAAGDWLTPAEWAERPVSSPQRKLADALANPRQPRLM